jgi:hypothetical protein
MVLFDGQRMVGRFHLDVRPNAWRPGVHHRLELKARCVHGQLGPQPAEPRRIVGAVGRVPSLDARVKTLSAQRNPDRPNEHFVGFAYRNLDVAFHEPREWEAVVEEHGLLAAEHTLEVVEAAFPPVRRSCTVSKRRTDMLPLAPTTSKRSHVRTLCLSEVLRHGRDPSCRNGDS